MLKKQEMAALGRLLSYSAALTTLLVTPWMSYEPINVPKLAVLTLCGFIGIGILGSNWPETWRLIPRHSKIISLLFILDLMLVLLVSGSNFSQEFFGTFGRATGFLAYFSLITLFLVGTISSEPNNLERFSRTLKLVGVLSVIYGFLQFLALDPVKWVGLNSPVIGFLGNENFQSSFLGFFCTLNFGYLISDSRKLRNRVLDLCLIILGVIIILKTNSQQGFFVFLTGLLLLVIIKLKYSRKLAALYLLIFSSVIGSLFTVLGFFQKGPLTNLVYQESITYRGDYWHAGWTMTIRNPFFGVGLDSYGDWYRRSRTLEATLRRGPDVVSNAAHNVFLDFSSNGGFPLVFLYICLMALVLISGIRQLRASADFNPAYWGLFAVWAGYQLQSIISINQLGLAVWGWIISGLLVGFKSNLPIAGSKTSKGKLKSYSRSASKLESEKVAPKTLIGMFIGMLAGLLIGLPPFLATSKFKSEIQSADVNRIVKASNIWPLEPSRFSQSALILRNNKYEREALSLVEDGLKSFPNDYGLWSLLVTMPTATEEQIAQARKEMKRLDPLNPNLK